MKAKELMIGDWVECVDSTHKKKVYAQVGAIEEGQTCILVEKECCNWFLDITFLNPIPLTPEILEKNGFVRNLTWHHCDIDIEDHNICVQLGYNNKIDFVKIHEIGKDNVVPSEKNSLYLTHIQYVHQLQHALWLCGIEKEITI